MITKGQSIRFLGAFAVCGFLYLLFFGFQHGVPEIFMFALFGLPFFMGFVVQTICDPCAEISLMRVSGWCIAFIAVMSFVLVLLQFEAVICVIMWLSITI